MNFAKNCELSLIIPCYNEAEVLPLLATRLLKSLAALNLSWEVIFVDDGSVDTTSQQLAAMHLAEPRFKVLSFSRNFGHQTAIYAGLSHASGQWVGIMDADLQDPPEILSSCMEKLREGYDVVYAVRRKRKENLLKRIAYALFYRILKQVAEIDIPLDSGDFCVMSRPVVEVLRQLPERNVFLRGLRAWTGFRQIGVEYEREARAAGETKYPLKKLVRLATDGIFAFSTLPLRLSIYLGLFVLLASMGLGFFNIAWRIFGFRFMGHTAAELPGWTTLVCGMLFLGGVQLLILGCIGEYIGRIYSEVKQRPRWIVRETLGLAPQGEDRVARTEP
ncbi:MAG: putative enzyme [Pedosphaera sp.]|nr:putative enzyme [Pedosphaera sp.]